MLGVLAGVGLAALFLAAVGMDGENILIGILAGMAIGTLYVLLS